MANNYQKITIEDLRDWGLLTVFKDWHAEFRDEFGAGLLMEMEDYNLFKVPLDVFDFLASHSVFLIRKKVPACRIVYPAEPKTIKIDLQPLDSFLILGIYTFLTRVKGAAIARKKHFLTLQSYCLEANNKAFFRLFEMIIDMSGVATASNAFSNPAPQDPSIDSTIDFLRKLKKDMEKKDAELEKVNAENAKLKSELKTTKDELTKANKSLENVKTEDDFVRRLVEATKEKCEGSPDDAKPVAQRLDNLGKTKEAKELRKWMKEEKKSMAGGNNIVDLHDNAQYVETLNNQSNNYGGR